MLLNKAIEEKFLKEHITENQVDDKIVETLNDSIQMNSPRLIIEAPLKEGIGAFTTTRTLKSEQISGLFVASEVDWQKVSENFTKNKGYTIIIDAFEQKVSEELKIKKIFPIIELQKDFASYCKAVVKLKTSSFSMYESKTYISQFGKEQNIPDEILATVLNWLKESTEKQPQGPQKKLIGFFDLVKFDILCYFDTAEFLKSRKSAIMKGNDNQSATTENIDGIQQTSIDKEAVKAFSQIANEVIERVAEQQVYPDLCYSFDSEKTSPFAIYFPERSDIKLIIKIVEESIKLGQTFHANALVYNDTGKILKVVPED